MFASQVYLWPLAMAAGGTVVSGLRYLTLYIGLKLALREAPKSDRLLLYREFARAVSLRAHPHEQGHPPPRTPHPEARARNEI